MINHFHICIDDSCIQVNEFYGFFKYLATAFPFLYIPTSYTLSPIHCFQHDMLKTDIIT